MRLKVNVSLIAISLIIILASVRGALVYHLGFPPGITYAVTAVLLLGLGALSFLNLHNSKPSNELVFLNESLSDIVQFLVEQNVLFCF